MPRLGLRSLLVLRAVLRAALHGVTASARAARVLGARLLRARLLGALVLGAHILSVRAPGSLTVPYSPCHSGGGFSCLQAAQGHLQPRLDAVLGGGAH